MDLATAGVMVLATFLVTSFCIKSPAALQPKPVYNVYDAVSRTPARLFMPAKAHNQAVVDSALAQPMVANGSTLHNGQQPYQPGDPGRWLLPDADTDFDDLARLLAGVHSMSELWSAYTLVQGIVLIMLVFRWVSGQCRTAADMCGRCSWASAA